MARLLGLGLLAALFFSSTFVLNRAMSLQGGHWAWAAILRYAWMLLFLIAGFVATGRGALLRRVLREYRANWLYWTLTGTLGFGVFYTGITAASAWAPGWVVATTWQLTILATPLVLLAFGRRVPMRGVLFALLIFAGVLLVNVEQAASGGGRGLLLGILPVLVAAFAYPLGMQMVWEARRSATLRVEGEATPDVATHRLLRTDADVAVLDQPFARVLLLVLGSAPWWVGLWAVVQPPPPTPGQWASTALVALLSGVVATTLFMQARHLAGTPYELAAVDSTQAGEVLFALGGEVLLLGGALPGLLGIAGVVLTIGGLALYLLAQGQGGGASRTLRAPRGAVDLRWYTLSG
jgi:drug/metabolite transporter (DMT)-like permease